LITKIFFQFSNLQNYIFCSLIFILTICNNSSFAQSIEMATLKGIVLDAKNKALESVVVSVPELNIGTNTSDNGKFELKIPANTNVEVRYSKIGFKVKSIGYRLEINQTKTVAISLDTKSNQIKDITKKASVNRGAAGNVRIDPKAAGIFPSTIGGIEGLLKIFVGSNNEMTSQYNVRGGNFDENLVYINDFEVYRPFLARSGQQEGLSIINSDLVSGVNFSTGGFQARYGDKMSSVLDVTYKKPKTFGGNITASLLGLSVSTEGISKNKRLSYLVGLRQKSNQFLLKAQQTSGAYFPSFTDAQTLLHYDINKKWSAELLGNYARNRFSYTPEEYKSSFGLINKAFQLSIKYQGSERDQFDSRFAGLSFTKKVNPNLTLKYLVSGFQTNEFETYDLYGEYLLGELETDLGKDNFGNLKYQLGTGIIHSFARNYLSINTLSVGHKGSFDKKNHFIQWGVQADKININDKLNEWERRDSAGFSQPVSTTELYMNKFLHSENIIDYTKISGYLQDALSTDSSNISITYGARFNYNLLNKQLLVSPRIQASYKPNSWKKDAVLRAAVGLYSQPPFYREMRNLDGQINTNVKAQKSLHVVLGTDYNFIAWKRPFKLTAESYYKKMWDLVPYEYDNIRIRYWGRNDAKGYAVGTECRLYGEIVKDAESWVSINVMKTGEDILDDKVYSYDAVTKGIIDSSYPGFIPRPTDSRVTFGLFFQDYFPTNHNIKVHINGMYGSGLPFGPPDNSRSGDTLRIPAYRRVDMGFSYLLVDGNKRNKPYYSLFHKFKSIWLSAEVFNLLDIRNTLSYTWIQDLSTQRTYAVPNRLTNRLLNVKLLMSF
jgi:hypothetical protein